MMGDVREISEVTAYQTRTIKNWYCELNGVKKVLKAKKLELVALKETDKKQYEDKAKKYKVAKNVLRRLRKGVNRFQN